MSDFISTHIYIYVLYVCYTIEIDSTGHPIPKAEKTGMYVCMGVYIIIICTCIYVYIFAYIYVYTYIY
jgi:hypothetical protein